MSKKISKTLKKSSTKVNEPIAVYEAMVHKTSSTNGWNPNVPFLGTQTEWREHFHRIEEGEFMTIEEADQEFEVWKKKLLASRM